MKRLRKQLRKRKKKRDQQRITVSSERKLSLILTTVRTIMTGSANKCIVEVFVDEYFPKKNDVQVYIKGEDIYDAKLNQSNVQDNNNKVIIFYAYTFIIINFSSTSFKSSKVNLSPMPSIATPDGVESVSKVKIRVSALQVKMQLSKNITKSFLRKLRKENIDSSIWTILKIVRLV